MFLEDVICQYICEDLISVAKANRPKSRILSLPIAKPYKEMAYHPFTDSEVDSWFLESPNSYRPAAHE